MVCFGSVFDLLAIESESERKWCNTIRIRALHQDLNWLVCCKALCADAGDEESEIIRLHDRSLIEIAEIPNRLKALLVRLVLVCRKGGCIIGVYSLHAQLSESAKTGAIARWFTPNSWGHGISSAFDKRNSSLTEWEFKLLFGQSPSSFFSFFLFCFLSYPY